MKDTYIFAIESSCDETSASIIKNGHEDISTVINSQILTELNSECRSSNTQMTFFLVQLQLSMWKFTHIKVIQALQCPAHRFWQRK